MNQYMRAIDCVREMREMDFSAWEQLISSKRLSARDLVPGPNSPRPRIRKPRRPNIRRAIAGVEAAGKTAGEVKLSPDGTITITIGGGKDGGTAASTDEWDREYGIDQIKTRLPAKK
jgi:hypothetical protein